jgi:uncharacterized protein YjlB
VAQRQLSGAPPVDPIRKGRRHDAGHPSLRGRRLPLLVYRRALAPEERDSAAVFERLFARNGWRGSWRDGIYPFHHFHSTSHEVLGVAGGTARVRFGGENGASLEVAAGDVVVIPAGVGHKNEGSSADFLVVGAYPEGRDWDVRRGDPAEREEVMANLARVPLPGADPVRGPGGPLAASWGDAAPRELSPGTR